MRRQVIRGNDVAEQEGQIHALPAVGQLVRLQVVGDLHGLRAGLGHHHAAVPAGRAGAHLLRLQQGDLQAGCGLGQASGGRQAGVAAADDGHVHRIS